MKATPRVGFFEAAYQAKPSFDPGLSPCPVCGKNVTRDNLTTVSLCGQGQGRSYFYRLHRTCGAELTEAEWQEIEEAALKAVQS